MESGILSAIGLSFAHLARHGGRSAISAVSRMAWLLGVQLSFRVSCFLPTSLPKKGAGSLFSEDRVCTPEVLLKKRL